MLLYILMGSVLSLMYLLDLLQAVKNYDLLVSVTEEEVLKLFYTMMLPILETLRSGLSLKKLFLILQFENLLKEFAELRIGFLNGMALTSVPL